jgi:hypothetical protein
MARIATSKHPPLQETDAAVHPAVGQRLEEADQIAGCSGLSRE